MIETREQLIKKLEEIIHNHWVPYDSWLSPHECATEICDLIATLNEEQIFGDKQ